MSKVSISKAAQLAGISRSHLYKYYIKKGKISLSKNEKGQPTIDISELLRVFGELQDNSSQATPCNTKNGQFKSANEAILQTRIEGLEILLKAYQEELARYREREQNYIDSERLYQRLLGDKSSQKRRWWLFGKD